jgi:hypothetical protein
MQNQFGKNMNVNEFRKKINENSVLIIDGIKYQIEELVKFRCDDGSDYYKCYLNDGFVLAEDSEQNVYQLLKHIKIDIKEPFSKKLIFKGKEFKFLYSAHAKAEEVSSEKHFGKNQSETFWDYESEDGEYLSLGINDWDKKRVDCIGKTIQPKDVDLSLTNNLF